MRKKTIYKSIDQKVFEARMQQTRLEMLQIARRKKRDEVRKELGKKEGVNYKRIILQSKITPKTAIEEVKYSVKQRSR